MNLSDFISFIGILLAIIAFIGEKERLFVINKFNKIDVLLIILIFFLINFLLFYNWWRKIFPILTVFENANFPFPNTWVYFILILFICWIFYKIIFSKFPKNNQTRVINYYDQLLQKEEYSTLYSIIYKYEKKYLLKQECNSQHNTNLINTIFTNKDFLFNTSNYNYQLFNKILLNNDNIDFFIIDNYIECHMKNPNSYIYNSKLIEKEKNDFFLLLEKSERLESIIIYIVKYNLVPLDKLLNLILLLSIHEVKIEINELYRIILQEITFKNDINTLKLFLIEYLEHNKKNYNTINSLSDISIILIETASKVENTSIFNDILQKYLDIILLLIKVKQLELENILLNIFKTYRSNNSKIFLSKIYDNYFSLHKTESKELEIILNKLYN